ncbi:hypothetical protein Tco_0804692 [Tanacetum coccineum]|uniref:Uncharacterized protein n=1 Tax=Tanacetum coccineum TaxID=301880 RepID=A0ABQ5A508_9ASTR
MYPPPHPSQPQISHLSIPRSQQYQSHQTSSVLQIAYNSPQPSTQPLIEFPQMDSGLDVVTSFRADRMGDSTVTKYGYQPYEDLSDMDKGAEGPIFRIPSSRLVLASAGQKSRHQLHLLCTHFVPEPVYPGVLTSGRCPTVEESAIACFRTIPVTEDETGLMREPSGDDDDDDAGGGELSSCQPCSLLLIQLTRRPIPCLSTEREAALHLPVHETETPEICLPLRKRPCRTTPGPGYKVGESSAAGTARQVGPATTRADLYGLRYVDTALPRRRRAIHEIAPTTLEGVNQRVTELVTTVDQEDEIIYSQLDDARHDRALLRNPY